MVPLTFEEAVGYFGVYVFLMGVCISLVVGLYALADLVEEHLKTTKKVILYTVRSLLALLVLLWVLEGIDLPTMLPTVAAPLGYWRIVQRRFPFISPKDPLLLLSAGMTVWAHVMWMRYHMSTFHHISVVLGFFLAVVWLVPMQVLVSLAANENALPGVASGMPVEYYAAGGAGGSRDGGGGGGSGRRGKATRTLLGSLFDRLRDGVLGPSTGRAKHRDL